MDQAGASPLDGGVLGDLDGALGPAFVAECITVYLDDAGRLRDGIEAALRSGDRAALTRAAHALGSASATVGARALSEWCRGIERDGPGADTAAELGRHYAEAVIALGSERDRRVP